MFKAVVTAHAAQLWPKHRRRKNDLLSQFMDLFQGSRSELEKSLLLHKIDVLRVNL